MLYREYDELIKSRLKPNRYVHSKNVAKKAAELGKMFGCDENRLYLAGLLHDICKNDTNENILNLFDEFGIILDNVTKSTPKLWHAIAGAVYVEKILKINDKDVISAIRWHTTGKPDMTDFEKIIFLADFISDERDYDGVEIIRKSVKNGLDEAVFVALRESIKWLCEDENALQTDSVNAYNYYCMMLKNKRKA